MDKLNYDPIYLEILRMAKELAIQEYTDVRAQDHNQWLVESEHLWRTQRLRLAYPTIPTPPTEQDIIARAQILLNFLAPKQEPKQETKKNPQQEVVDQRLTTQEIIDLEEKEIQIVKEPPPEAKEIKVSSDVEDAKEIIKEPELQNEQSSLGGRILPSVIKKIEELKNSWGKN